MLSAFSSKFSIFPSLFSLSREPSQDFPRRKMLVYMNGSSTKVSLSQRGSINGLSRRKASFATVNIYEQGMKQGKQVLREQEEESDKYFPL